jgi:hypothetical protein
MLTNRGHVNSALRQGATRLRHTTDRPSLRLRDALIGAVALVSILSAILVIPVAASFGWKGTPVSRALAIAMFVFPPAMLGAVYSLFFEASKLYGALALLLAGIALVLQPLTWDWLEICLPFACAFTALCAVVRVLERRPKR